MIGKRLNNKRVRLFQPEPVNNYDIRGDGLGKILLDRRPKPLKKLLKNNEGANVVKVEICRVPISEVFRRLINVFSLGALKRRMKKADYDKLFHLYLIIHLDNGKKYRVEKNARLTIYEFKKKTELTECKEIDGLDISLNDFMLAPEVQNADGLYQYSSFKNNCQDYVMRVLTSNGINEYEDFIKQDVFKLVPRYIKVIANLSTNVVGVTDLILKGDGIEKDAGQEVYDDILDDSQPYSP